MVTDDTLIIGTRHSGTELEYAASLGIDDRRRHIEIIGKTGTGKSSLLLNCMLADLAAGRGFALLDPHGDLATTLLDAVLPHRTNDVLYFNPADLDFPVGFNPLDTVSTDARPLVAANLVAAFKHTWADSWGPRLEYILQNSIRLLLDNPGSTLLGLTRLLVDEPYRNRLLASCRDPLVLAFWTRELPAWGDAFAAEALSPVQNKIGALLSPPVLRNIIGQTKSTIDIAGIMNSRRVLIANLSKATLGEGPAHLLGALLATAFAQAAEARAAIPEDKRVDFTLYADEFQNFATDSFGLILSEARKWRLSLVLAHQFLGQLSPQLRQSVVGNVGSLVVFRTGADDAEAIVRELGIASPGALTELPNHTAWVKLMQNGNPTDAMRIDIDLPIIETTGRSSAIIARTRARHTRPRAIVEEKIARLLNPEP